MLKLSLSSSSYPVFPVIFTLSQSGAAVILMRRKIFQSVQSAVIIPETTVLVNQDVVKSKVYRDTDDLGDDDAEDVTEDDDNLGDDDSVVKDGRLGDSKASGDEGLGKDKAIEDTDDLVNDIVEDVTEDGDNLGNANVSIIFLPQIFNHCIDVQSPQ